MYVKFTVWLCCSEMQVWFKYCVVVCPRVIYMVCVLCDCVVASHMNGVCTVWWCVNVLYLWYLYCVLVWKHAEFIVCVLRMGVACY